MTDSTDVTLRRLPASPLAWVVPGPLRQVTGGYLYDARIVDGLRAGGRSVGVIDLRSTGWPLDRVAGGRLLGALSRGRWSAVVVDELAHPAVASALLSGRLRQALGGAPLVLLVHHLRASEPAPWAACLLATTVERAVVRAADLVVCTSETTARTVRSLARQRTEIVVVRPGWDTHGTDLTPQPTGDDLNPQPTGDDLNPQPAGDDLNPQPAGDDLTPQPARDDLTPQRTGEDLTRQPAEDDLTPQPPLRRGEGEQVSCHPLSVPVGARFIAPMGGEVRLKLLLVGHWTPRKGILVALDALKLVDRAVSLDLVGEQDRDRQYADRVQAALRHPVLGGRVRVHGRVSDARLAALYAEADALVLPSSYEGYGMVLAEALTAGLPIVATRVGAVPEVVRDGREAVLVPPDDPIALAQAMTRLQTAPDGLRCRAADARERARSLPRWSESIAAFDGHLCALLARTLTGA